MAEYENATDRAYEKEDEMKLKFGMRAAGDKNGSVMEACADKRVPRGTTRGAEARAHLLQFGDKNTNARFLGGDVGANSGLDFESCSKEGHVFGAEAKARATLVECTTGPVSLHVGAGVSTSAKVEGGTIEAKFAGSGFKVGKKIGISVFDNEISINTAALVGKGWLW